MGIATFSYADLATGATTTFTQNKRIIFTIRYYCLLLSLKKDEFSEDEEIDDESTLIAEKNAISNDVIDSVDESNILIIIKQK